MAHLELTRRGIGHLFNSPIGGATDEQQAGPTERFVEVRILRAADVAREPVVEISARGLTYGALYIVLGVTATL